MHKGASKKPKYKIGDCIVYKDRYNKDDMGIYYQSNIIECVGYLEENDPHDSIGWFYTTEETNRTGADNLEEKDIMYKL